MKYVTTPIHISNIKVGDTVIHNGDMKTVSGNNLKKDVFMGSSIFGDTYKLGHTLVQKVIFITN